MKLFDLPVIYFHSIAPRQNYNWSYSHLTLELHFFEELLKYLRRNKYETILLDEFIDNANEISSDKVIALSFDDGYLDNWIYVFPLLKKFEFNATIFISPETVDKQNIIRPNLDDYWLGKINWNDLDRWGYLSWQEMLEMQKTGLFSFQSHTMSHTKYFISEKINGFHHPGSNRIYPLWNTNPELKPYYIGNPSFNNILPFGYPLFEEESAVTAHRIFINDDFNSEVVDALKNYDWSQGDKDAYKIIQPLLDNYTKKNILIHHRENEREHQQRINYEVVQSKKIMEMQLGQPVTICCWPHGNNSEYLHDIAVKNGYKATTIGKFHGPFDPAQRIGPRIGVKKYYPNNYLSLLRIFMRIKAYQKKFPYYSLKPVYHLIKHQNKI